MQSISCLTFFLLLLNGILFSLMPYTEAVAQRIWPPAKNTIRNLVIRVDTLQWSYAENPLHLRDDHFLPFTYHQPSPVAELTLHVQNPALYESISLLPSSDYDITDSLRNFNNEHLRAKIRFLNLNRSDFMSLVFQFSKAGQEPYVEEVRLFPYFCTAARLQSEEAELYIGEEKVFEIFTDNIDNIRPQESWTENLDINYRITKQNRRLFLHLLPARLGAQSPQIRLRTFRPCLEGGRPQYELPPLRIEFNVKQSRISFLNPDRNDVTLDEEVRTQGVEIQIDNHRLLKMQRTYRIEKQEEPGGALVGELFTRTLLANNRVLCWLRLYNYHQTSDSYLYLKDGDKAEFITNFNITPRTSISSVQILRPGAEWTDNLSVFPGEEIEVRIQGEALNKALFVFEGLNDVLADSTIKTNRMQRYQLRIPMSFARRNIDLYNHGQKTNYTLAVREYQRARQMDFITVDFGAGPQEVDDINAPVLYYKTVQDVVIGLKPEVIDAEKLLYGKQYLSLEIRVLSDRNQLIEIVNVENIVVCPTENSPRFSFYNMRDCNRNSINLNNLLRNKTFNLNEWSRIELTFRHHRDKYRDDALTKRIEIVCGRLSSFDVDVSFPAGLLLRRLDEQRIRTLGGISISAIAQFKFYKKGAVARVKPFRIGAGTIAINAFNFNENNVNRDLGLVLIGSVFPLQRDNRKLSFPLFAGFGYLLRDETWFFLVGPGIRVNF